MRAFVFVSAIYAVALSSLASAQQCGPLSCYVGKTCEDKRLTPVDFAFVIDRSASMQDKIDAVAAGLTNFVNNLSTGFDPRFSIIEFGASNQITRPNSPTRGVRQFNVPSTGQAAFYNAGGREAKNLAKGQIEGIMNNLREAANGAIENGLEAIQFAVDKVEWRPQATRKSIIFLTDEDSDPAAGRFDSARITQESFFSPVSLAAHLGPNVQWSEYQATVDKTAQSLIDEGVSIYFLVKTSNRYSGYPENYALMTPLQYGDPATQIQNPNFSGFNVTETYKKMQETVFRDNTRTVVSSTPRLTEENSVQGQIISHILKTGDTSITARVFDLAALDQTGDLIRNVYGTIQNDVSVCDKTCLDYPCDTANRTACAAPVNICDCAGVPRGPAKRDCAGVCNGPAKIDPCTNECVASGIVRDARACACPSLRWNECGCIGDPTLGVTRFCVPNCEGKIQNFTNPDILKDSCGDICGGDKRKNQCGVCGVTLEPVLADSGLCPCGDDGKFIQPTVCAGGFRTCKFIDTPTGPKPSCPPSVGCDPATETLVCGECRPRGSNTSDLKDPCGRCITTDGSTDVTGKDVKDCKDTCFGDAYVNLCQECLFKNETSTRCKINCKQQPYLEPAPPGFSLNCLGECVAGQITCSSKCGNARLDDGEECDFEMNNGERKCTFECKWETPVGPNVVGIAVGASVGAVVVALGAFFLYKYLVKSGLLGSAHANVDMGGSNSNPLYQQQSTVAENPLYKA